MSGRGGGTLYPGLILLSVCLGVLDSLLPRPIPFLKIGLANLPAVIVSVRLGFRRTLGLNLTRSLAVALFTGTLATPAFLLSSGGALASAVAMAGPSRGVPGRFSLTGVSVSGACGNIWAQLGIAALLFPGLPLRGLLLPATLWGIVSGTLVGFGAAWFMARILRTGILSPGK